MAILNIGGQSYNYPDPGREPGWGEDATAWAEAVTEAIGSSFAAGDIRGSVDLPPAATATNVESMLINSVDSVAGEVLYYVSGPTQFQTGKLTLTRTSSNWRLTREYVGDSIPLILTVTSSGQIQYTLGGSDTLTIKFRFSTVEV